jgi:hypothetical protein
VIGDEYKCVDVDVGVDEVGSVGEVAGGEVGSRGVGVRADV